jgi:hypothetical protein
MHSGSVDFVYPTCLPYCYATDLMLLEVVDCRYIGHLVVASGING